jgi:superfamily II DNA/RNA helicase
MSFSTLGLDSSLPATLAALGYTEPTPVQREAIPAVLAGGDLLVSSQTGSGKTAAFLVPGLQRLRTPAAASRSFGPRMLVLAPTRELAMQVQKASQSYGSGQRLAGACLVGGVPFGLQLKQVRKPLDLVVATPGRLLDHLNRGSIDLERVELLVLDEADRMLDMGFQDELDAIIAKVPATRQTLLFSATLDGVVGRLAQRVTKNAKRIAVAAAKEERPDITQHALFADNGHHKECMLDSLLRETDVEQALVFTATKRSAQALSATLQGKGFTAGALHGDMHQRERSWTLQRMREGRMRVLVATDVAARGIDVPGINLVVNFDPPNQSEDYVHRIGRTGRAGRAGVAVTFLESGERHLVRELSRKTGGQLNVMEIPGLEPKKVAATRPDSRPKFNPRAVRDKRPQPQRRFSR